ncbi:MAG: hypothetical protein JST22_15595 [Bacteroidetes bacterium]|nr:hypothetical protein [Bacteroidota bacterium]
MAKQKPSPATAFLLIAIFNLIGAVAFFILYFADVSAGGRRSYLYLVIGGIFAVLGVVSYLLYPVFKKRLDRLRQP